MTPKSFPESNITLKGEGCLDLPGFTDGKEIVSCWQPNEEEMEYLKKCIENNTIPEFYLAIMGSSQPPVFVGAGHASMFTEEKSDGKENNSK